MTTDTKQSIREQVIQERNKVIINLDKIVASKKVLENEYDKYFKEIHKYSNDFKLVKTPQVCKQSVYATHGNERILVDTISQEYNSCEIIYVGKLPKGNGTNFNIQVEEHRTTDKYGWSKNNHGYKLKLRIDWDKEKYYKSVKTFISRIQEKVDDVWNRYDNQIKFNKQRQLALTFAGQKFNNAVVTMKNNGGIEVEYPNRVKVNLSFNSDLETGEVKFRIISLIPPANLEQEQLMDFLSLVGKF